MDEYYQALGMDHRRELWLRNQILRVVNDAHIFDELGVTKSSNDDELLTSLDTWLCDLKEAQIRNGLHGCGQALNVNGIF